jgi:hypothetical protein
MAVFINLQIVGRVSGIDCEVIFAAMTNAALSFAALTMETENYLAH